MYYVVYLFIFAVFFYSFYFTYFLYSTVLAMLECFINKIGLEK